MIDIHCHILYGVDDGSFSLEETVKLAEIAEQGGTEAIIATPHSNVPDSYINHWNNDFEEKIVLINKALAERGIDITVYRGQEIFCAGRFEELMSEGKLITLNNSRYPLIEFDFYERSHEAYVMAARLAAQGYVPIVAHPERYQFICEEEEAAERLKDIGCLLQVNKGSLKGSFGFKAQRAAFRLLDEGLADFVASDAHSPYMRTPFLGNVREMISEEFSPDYAELLLSENPGLVIENKEILTY